MPIYYAAIHTALRNPDITLAFELKMATGYFYRVERSHPFWVFCILLVFELRAVRDGRTGKTGNAAY